MRNSFWVLAVFTVLGLSGRSAAQSSASTILGGPSPASIISRPIDTSKVVAPSVGLPASQSRFNFTTLFSKMSMPSFPVKRGMSAQPIPSSFPSTSYTPFKMVGKPPFLMGDPKRSARPLAIPKPQIPMQPVPASAGG